MSRWRRRLERIRPERSGKRPGSRRLRRRVSRAFASLRHRVETRWIRWTGHLAPGRVWRTVWGVALLVGIVSLGARAGLQAYARSDVDERRHTGSPILPPLPREYTGVPLRAYLDGAVPEAHRDALLASPVLSDPEFTRRVHWWVGYWTGPARDWFPGFLDRMAWLGTSVDSALATHGFPPSLRYLPLIESGYAPDVTSGASAVGLWQLMAPTARELGLEVTPLLDERRDIQRSTDAALRYLGRLYDEFGSWHLALAAYNTGPTRVRRLLAREATDSPRTDSLFWALRERFAPETRDFLPKLYGAMWVASKPEAYGYTTPEADPVAFDVVRVPDQTTLDVVARAAGVPHAEILRLNPEFVRGITPPGRSVDVRVPRGRGGSFSVMFALIPPDQRVTFVEHVVQAGETLGSIAARYGVGAGEIEQANPGLEPRLLSIGIRLTVPVAPALGAGDEVS